MAKAGLRKVTKSVRGKHGTVRRSYWVRGADAVKGAGRFLNKHKGKIAAGAALAAGAVLAARHRGAIKGAYQGAKIANAGAGGVSRGLRAVTGKGLGVGTRLKTAWTGAKVGAAVGGAHDTARRAAGSVMSAADKVRSVPAGIRGGIAGARMGANAAWGVGKAGTRALPAIAQGAARAAGGVQRAGVAAIKGVAHGTSRAVRGILGATPSLAKAGAAIGYHGNRAKLAFNRARGRKS